MLPNGVCNVLLRCHWHCLVAGDSRASGDSVSIWLIGAAVYFAASIVYAAVMLAYPHTPGHGRRKKN